MATYVEHTACKVKDLDWCVKFFTEVFDMPIRLSLGEKPNRKIWLHDIALMTTDYDNVHEKCLAWGCTVLPAGDNWLKMPNGIVIELKRGNNEVLHTIISQKPWVD